MKFLIIGDLHIHDYAKFNLEASYPSFRLQQFLILADEIIKVIQSNNIEEFIIAGDLLYKPNPNPMVLSILHEFLNRIAAYANIRIIPGNHDIHLKQMFDGVDIDYHNNLKLFANSKIFYYTDKIERIGAKTFHFHGWTPNGITVRDADILIAHDVVVGAWYNNLISATGIETGSYNKAFVGHIHHPQQIGNAYIPGSPIPHNFGDADHYGGLIYDDEMDNVVSVDFDRNRFLNFITFDSVTEQERYINDEAIYKPKYVAMRVEPAYVKELSKMLTEDNISGDYQKIDPLAIVNDLIKDYDDSIKSIIQNILNKYDVTNNDVPSLRFNLISAKINNFLTIKEAVFDFKLFKHFNIVVGDNGSGKSTFFKFIQYMILNIVPKKSKGDVITDGEERFSGELVLEYENNIYTIRRSKTSKESHVEFLIDNIPVSGNTMLDIEKEIKDKLKFVKFWDIIFVNQSSAGIFAAMSDSNRVSFLSQFINLPLIDAWTNEANEVCTAYENTLQQLLTETNNKLVRIEQLQEFVAANDGEYIDIKPIEQSINDLRQKMYQYTSSIAVIKNTFTENEKQRQLKTDLIASINSREQQLIEKNAAKIIADKSELEAFYKAKYDEFQAYNVEQLQANIANKKAEFDATIADTKAIEQTITENVNNLTQHQWLIKNAKEQIITKTKLIEDMHTIKICPTCGQNMPFDKQHVEQTIANMRQEIADLEASIITTTARIEELNVIIATLNQQKMDFIEAANQRKQFIQSEIDALHKEYYAIAEKNQELQVLWQRLQNLNSQLANIDQLTEFIAQEKERLQTIQVLDEKDIEQLNQSLATYNENIVQLENEINAYSNTITVANQKNALIDQAKLASSNIQVLKEERLTIQRSIDEHEKIYKHMKHFRDRILSDSGLLVAKLLESVAAKLNTDPNLRVVTTKTLKNKTVKPTLNIELFVEKRNRYVEYDDLSGGEILIADILFLKGLTYLCGGIGCVFLDEIFKFFDESNIFYCCDILKQCNFSQMFLIVHPEDLLVNIADTVTRVSLENDASVFHLQIN